MEFVAEAPNLPKASALGFCLMHSDKQCKSSKWYRAAVTRSDGGQWQLRLGQLAVTKPLPDSLAASLSDSTVQEAFQQHPGAHLLYLVCSKAKQTKKLSGACSACYQVSWVLSGWLAGLLLHGRMQDSGHDYAAFP
jgi:hypothetical protein